VIALLDVNVLVALAWPNHEHHHIATEWFWRNQRHGWATCPLTQSGFVRVSSNNRVLPSAKSPREAATLLREIVAVPGHVFLPDEISLITSRFVDTRRLMGHRQVTDAHLLGIALGHGAKLATLDRSILELVPSPFLAGRVVWLVQEMN
jgi:toxin-antitoxin system PIN domain toxin